MEGALALQLLLIRREAIYWWKGSKMTRTLLLALLLASALRPLPGAAAVEPRAGPAVGPAPELPDALKQDPRLEKPVPLRMVRRPLAEVAAALSKATGARVQAAAAVADEPAIVWMADQPAS